MANSRVGSHPSHGGQLVENATSSFSLTPNDSGKTFILKDAAVTVTLPTLSTDIAGFQVTLISGDDSEHIVTGGASKIYGHSVDASGNAAETILPLTGHSTITPAAGVAIGDKFEIISDGTNWYMFCITGAEVVGS
tara:strand:+ start:15 stop:422 length:408 start_codon:yes stop_codon:yes gene_type:complete